MLSGSLLHRDRELAVLAGALRRTEDGQPAIVLIEGPRGMGKTALLRAALTLVPDHAVVLQARCIDAEREFGLAMVRQLFDPLVERSRGENSPDGYAVSRLDASAAPAHADDSAADDLLRDLFHITRSLAATKPVVIVIDDLTSADPHSMRWFTSISRRLDGLPVALIATVDSDAADRLPAAFAALTELPYAHVVRPGPLCQTCAAEWVEKELGAPLDSELAEACHALSLGNPRVLRELTTRLLGASVSPGSPDLNAVLTIGAATLAATTLKWLQEHNPAAVDLLTNLAILGPNGDLATSAVLAGQGEFEAEQAREVLQRTGLMSPGSPDRLRSDVIRLAVLSRLDTPTRLDRHRRAAELLARLDAPTAHIAEHLMSLGATNRPWTLRILRAAAHGAEAAGDWDLAARYLRQALTESPDPSTTVELIGSLGAVELHRDGLGCSRHAVTAALTAVSPADRAEALLPFANPVLIANSGVAAKPFVEAARELSAAPSVSADLLLPMSAQSMLAGYRAGVQRSIRALQDNEAMAVAGDFLGAWAALTASSGRYPRTAARLAKRSVRSNGAAGTDVGTLGAALALSWVGQCDPALTLMDQVIGATRRRNRPAELGLGLIVRADIAYRQDQWANSLSDAREAGVLADEVNAPGLRAAARACAARALLRLGHLDAARRQANPSVPGDLHPLVRGLVLQSRGMVAAASGEHPEALRLFLECGHQLVARGISNPACVTWREQAAAEYQALGEFAAARAIEAGSVANQVRAGGASARPVRASRASVAKSSPTLSAGERRVVDLVLEGMSNLEVADRLCLSKRTVDTHLGRVYRKLEICGRPELASAVELSSRPV